ncbi:MAG: hypothetical protein JO063_10800, partial [Pseudonocardiales bacterium]|nr:hypothetical protein [Pseudonocardiales bacterium]
MSGRRVVVALLAMMLGAAVVSVLPGATPASAAGAPPGSAMTKSGDAKFPGLQVTVSQTTNLINQVVTVSWTGGAPTRPLGAFGVNYLQIMQCWGGGPGAPDRTQCQYGGSNTGSAPAGAFVRSRQVSYGPGLVDPEEKFKLPAGTFGSAFVPFWAVGTPQPTSAGTSDTNAYFDSQVTNEDPLARTHSDGSGVEYFEVQTVRQAAGLGCGDPVTTGGVLTGRSCWLVVVPRGDTEVDGSTRAGDAGHLLDSSPLSQSNWDHRIMFPLDFLPVGQACPIGAPERRMIGHEMATDAVGSWQPALCAGGGTLYSYTQLTDDVTRSQVIAGSSPGLALVTTPISPDQAPAGHPLVYAPVGLSGLAIAFNIEHQPPPPDDPNAPPTPEQKLDGQRFTSMKLTPRLVAKLLTQSYRNAVLAPPDSMKNNPKGLTVDPDFLALNPDYQGFAFSTTPPDALVQLGSADVTSLLWSWVNADPDAHAFLTGTPDKFGMVVNPLNVNLTLPTSTFPRNDQSCVDSDLGNGVTGRLCTQDAHPFTLDMHDAGRSAGRGDSKAQTLTVGSNGKTPTPTKVARQAPGQRALLAVVDTATAARYGLPTAALLNAKGQYVTPTTASLLAGEVAMKPSAVPGVLAPNPGATNPAAYPLTALSYAVTSPSALDVAAGKNYAAFLRYAAGPGQQPGIAPGQLPLGMAPLPDALKAQTIAAAATIEAQAGKALGGPPAPQPLSAGGVPGGSTGSTGSSGGPSATAGIGGGTTSPGGGSGVPSPAAVPQGGSGPAAKVPSVAQQPVAGVLHTPALSAPAVGALLLTTLISGALAATSSPILQSPVIHRLGAAVRR